MTLTQEEAERFYNLFFPLLDYANRKYKTVPKLKKIYYGMSSIYPADAKQIADRIWSDTKLIDEYLSKAELSPEDMSIVSNWKKVVRGKFVVERHLKNGSVFIGISDGQVYLVKGLLSTWEEMLGGAPLPLVLRASLLPFNNVIITDGLVGFAGVYIGRNTAMSLKNTYLDAKEAGKIIKSL